MAAEVRRTRAQPFLSVAVTLGCAAGAVAQPWTFGSLWLQPPKYGAFVGSHASGVSANVQVGFTTFDGPIAGTYHDHAWLCHGLSRPAIDLHPSNPAVTDSVASAVRDGQQVGYIRLSGSSHAGLWTGSAQSWIDLHPSTPGITASEAVAVADGQQVGTVWFSNTPHASLWSGSAASWVDLHPDIPGVTWSLATAVSQGRQGGRVLIGGASHAALWSGSSSTFMDLHPPGRAGSCINGIAGNRQVGWVLYPGQHASLWRGIAETWTDLHPAGANVSNITATTGEFHAGSVDYHAALWFGDTTSWYDLQTLLPPSWDCRGSSATGIARIGNTLYITGWGSFSYREIRLGLLWVGSVPGSCYANCDASTAPPALNVNDFVCFLNRFADGDGFANCDGSTTPPILNVSDFLCFLNSFAAGCT